jgi:hypothetical protein
MTTTMWTLQDVLGALDTAQKNFLRLTGVTVARLGFDGDGDNSTPVIANQETVPRPQNSIDIIRAAFVNYDASMPPKVVAVNEMAREDAAALDLNDRRWETDFSVTPPTYSESHFDPSVYVLGHPAINAGGVDLTFVAVSQPLTGNGVPLNIPDDCADAILWEALSILLDQEGEAYDPERSEFAHGMFMAYVDLTVALLSAPEREAAG